MQSIWVVITGIGILTFIPSRAVAQEMIFKAAHGKGAILDMNFSKDGGRLLTLGTDRKVNVWNLRTKKACGSFSFPSGLSLGNLRFLEPPESFLVVARQHGGPRPPIGFPMPIEKLKGHSDNQWFEVRQCDIETDKRRVLFRNRPAEIPANCFVVDGTAYLAGPCDAPLDMMSYYLTIKPLKSDKERKLFWKEEFTILDISHDGKIASLLFSKAKVRFVCLDTQKTFFEFDLNVDFYRSVVFFPDGNRFVAVSKEDGQTLHFGDVAKKSIVTTRRLVANFTVIDDISANGRFIGFSGVKLVLVWDAKSEELLHISKIHTSRWSCIRFSPTNETCLAADAHGDIYEFKLPGPK